MATAGAGRKKPVDLDSSSDFDFGATKPKKQLMRKAEPKPKAAKPKAQKAAPKKKAEMSLSDSSDGEYSGKKKATNAAV